MLLPQLSSKSSVQFRTRLRIAGFRAANHVADGSLIQGEATRPLKRSWAISYQGLTISELSALDSFCNTSDAAVDGFVFVDPFRNALSFSEDLMEDVWIKSPLVDIEPIPASEPGAYISHLLTNVGNSEQVVKQELAISGTGRFCASCMVRSNAPAFGRLTLIGSASTHAEPIQSQSEWVAVYLSADVECPTAPLSLGVGIDPGCAIEIKRIQLEHQPYPSQYKPTTGTGGIQTIARILPSSYLVVQQGPDWFDCSFGIEA